MFPEDGFQAFKDLRGKVLFPIHNGTFALAFHAWYEPLEKINAIAKTHNAPIAFPKMGEAMSIFDPIYSTWWREVIE